MAIGSAGGLDGKDDGGPSVRVTMALEMSLLTGPVLPSSERSIPVPFRAGVTSGRGEEFVMTEVLRVQEVLR